MKAASKILLLAVIHFVAGVVAFGIAFSRSMHRFDYGGEKTAVDAVCDTAVHILWFPFRPVARFLGVHGGGPAEWLLFGANSFLWGAALYFGGALFWRCFVRDSPPSEA